MNDRVAKTRPTAARTATGAVRRQRRQNDSDKHRAEDVGHATHARRLVRDCGHVRSDRCLALASVALLRVTHSRTTLRAGHLRRHTVTAQG
jgi:hypothetical protein